MTLLFFAHQNAYVGGQAEGKAVEVDSLVWDVSSFPRKEEGGMSFTKDPSRNNGIKGDESSC